MKLGAGNDGVFIFALPALHYYKGFKTSLYDGGVHIYQKENFSSKSVIIK